MRHNMQDFKHRLGDGQGLVLRPARSGRREIGIEDLLHWAFAKEWARLEFVAADEAFEMLGYGYVSSTAAIIRHEQLGCRVDGGGRSLPHPDADVVASAVATLPEARGGRRMAVVIAEHARAGTRPDAMPGAVPRCVPVEWTRRGRGGREQGKAEIVGRITYLKGGRLRSCDVRAVPVTYRPTADQIAAARRHYLDWWGALRELRASFQAYGGLSAWGLTNKMPPMEPWKTTGC